LLNKLHVCGKIISFHKTPLRDGFHSNNTHEYEVGLDKKLIQERRIRDFEGLEEN